MSYNDDRPGMMRVHIAELRGEALAAAFTLDHLKMYARRAGISPGRSTKRDLATRLAYIGYVAPGYDKAAER